MKQIIREIAEGNFKYENGTLDFSCPRVELSVQAGEMAEGSFFIYGAKGVVTEGRIVSSDMRMSCLASAFGGSQDEIFYRFDASGASAGEEIRGAFHMISNQGEYDLPFSVSVTAEAIASSMGEIRNLFHFTNLAKSSWEEAVKLFYSPVFERILTGNDAQHYAAYKGLSAVCGNEHNVEEFLLEINKKKPVEFLPEETQIRIAEPAAMTRYTLVVRRNGWGYTSLRVETEGDFLKVDEKLVTEDAFLGNLYRLYYYIQDEKLHAGNNYGCIRLISFEKTVTVPVTVIRRAEIGRKLSEMRREQKRVTMQLIQNYQAYRLKKISARRWMKESGGLVERLKEVDGSDISAKLFQAQLFMTQERFHEAEWILEQGKDEIEKLWEEKPELGCYYLYLTTLNSKSDRYVEGIARRIAGLYERNRGNWRIAWLLLFVSEEYTRSAARKWALLEELFACGCRSPVIYLEAWNLICMNPAMLMKLGDFELQILNFAAKNEAMKDDVMIQFLYLAQKQKGYSGLLLQILISCYEKKPQNDILHAVCATLMKGNKQGSGYFKWYQAGVEQNLRITRLYEYYMMSVTLDDRQTLPKMILMYFSYQSDLHYEITAWLYAYVWKHQEEIPEIYISYLSAIEHFVIEQIKRGRINRNLAYLYRNVLEQSMVDAEVAEALMELLFMQDITVESDTVRQVVLVYPYGVKEMSYPVTNRRAQVPVFDEECKIVLEDGERNRYTKSISCKAEQLITTNRLFQLVSPFIREHLGYSLYVCCDHKSGLCIQEENAERFRYLADSDFMAERNRREIRIGLVRFYYEKDRMWELDDYLLSLEPGQIAEDDRKEVVRIMVFRGMYKEAYAWVRKTGPYRIDVKTLVRLFSRLLSQNEAAEDDAFTTGVLQYVVRKKKYDEQILKYLNRYYNGSIKDMRDIWKAAVDFGVDAYEIGERIIVQTLYTGSYIDEEMEIFDAYARTGGKEEVISAFLSQVCYDYVIGEKSVDSAIFRSIRQMYREKEELHPVCQIAYLKYYEENPKELADEMKEMVTDFLRGLLRQNIVLPLFKSYQGYLPALDMLQDKALLEYRAKPGRRVTIHYLIQREDGKEQEYCKETMRDMFAGICVKEFILFFGERLQYYITEETDGKEQVTESGTISRNDGSSQLNAGSRFQMLNDIMTGRTMQDYDTVDTLLAEYYKKDFMTDKLFTLR
ncbi:MAG: DUF5717 family protein [Blautia sp.]|nr:DUF5717 family protein [Blautia sp.]MCM1201604.1 DUF5717 family protein [Bacteroides fragilis]